VLRNADNLYRRRRLAHVLPSAGRNRRI